MGQPPQRAARLYFRTTSVSRKNAHGPGLGECRGARTGGTGESSAGGSRNSCSLARAKRRSVRGKRSSCSRRCFAVSSVVNFHTNWIAVLGEFSDSITGGGCYITGAKRITKSEIDCIAFAGGFSCDVAISSTSK